MNDAPKRYKDDREAESRRILASVNDEMQVSGVGVSGVGVSGVRMSGVGNQLANRIGNHFAAREADQADKVEVLGRRIGRVLSLIFCLGLIIWLAIFIKRNAG